ncbi:MAG: hypothetical protein U0790_19630 [Isosphaeraceae bacterium]
MFPPNPRPPSRTFRLVLAAFLATAFAGCAGSSSPVEGQLNDAARKQIIQRKVDVQDRPARSAAPRPRAKGS